jgi:chemotaxis family two-component system sensor kinase Cph1
MIDTDTDIDITSCEQEPIHLIGSIQSDGVLLAIEVADLHISHASVNASSLFGITHQELIGLPIERFLSAEACHHIRQVSQLAVPAPPSQIISAVPASSPQLISVHKAGGVVILEFEALVEPGSEDTVFQIFDKLSFLFSTSDLAESYSLVCTELQRITEFDRVLIYRFSDDFSGSVVAEKKLKQIPSFLGHKFPGSDIPRQARELYLKNRIRALSDVHAAPVPVLPEINTISELPLDLSLSILRSMSPIHVQYLKNMGVSASLSISIVKESQLWALIVCHHFQPKFVTYRVRALCSVFANVFSAFITRVEKEERSAHLISTMPLQARVLERIEFHKDVVCGLQDSAGDLLALTNASGFAIYFKEHLVTFGLTPSNRSIYLLLQWLGTDNRSLVETNCLSSVFPGGTIMTKSASGIIATPIPSSRGSWLIWFRPESSEKVLWAGNPYKANESASDELNPRKSFESWNELMRGKTRPWRQFEIDSALALRNAISDFVVQQVLEHELLEEQLQKQRNIFQKQRNDLLAALAHDLQIPSVGATRLLNFLLDSASASEPIPDNLRTLLSALRDSSVQQLKRIVTLMDVLRYEDRPIGETELSVIELEDVISQCLQELLTSAAIKRVTIRHSKRHADATVLAEPTSLSRLLVNLLDNAIKFSPEGGVVEIFVRRKGTQTKIHIKDNGPGISAKNKIHLFDSLWQGAEPGKVTAGVGMGLYLCQQIATALGGEISCISTAGRGATFIVTLQSPKVK